MTKPLIRIHDLATDEIIDREMTVAEYKIHQEKIAKYEKQQAEAEAKATQRQAIAERLGLTAEELQVLLG